MTAKILKFKNDDRDAIVERLRELADDVEKGAVKDVALAARYADKEEFYTSIYWDNWLRTVGAVAVLYHDILHHGDVPESD